MKATSRTAGLLLLVCHLLVVLSARADDSGSQACRCFRGRPQSECTSFFITEFAYLKRLARDDKPNTDASNDKDFYFLAEVGWMKNLNPKTAVGGTLSWGFDDDNSRVALKPRYRRWLTRRMNLDVSMGIIVWNLTGYEDEAPGFTGKIGIGYGDWFGLITQVEMIPYRNRIVAHGQTEPENPYEGTETVWYAGLQLGSYPGTASMVVAPLTVLILFLITYEA